MTAIDFSAFVDQLAAVAGETILPFFRTSIGIDDKGPAGRFDPVTAADRAAEQAMRSLIQRNFPAHGIIGEEFGSDRADAEYVWVLDPIDGTKSFIAGSPDFATMCALVREGEAVASWIWQPMHGQLFTASRGGGAFAGGTRLSRPEPPSGLPPSWRGVLRTRYMPAALRDQALAGFESSGLVHESVTAAGVVYPLAATGALSHALYWRTLPWDHAPGALLAQEAGMVVARLDGAPYRPWDGRFGLLTAVDGPVWDTERGALPADIDDSSIP